jgi:hypothetical protein
VAGRWLLNDRRAGLSKKPDLLAYCDETHISLRGADIYFKEAVIAAGTALSSSDDGMATLRAFG